MEREQSYAIIMQSFAKMQQDIAIILEAKAVETEKVRNWLCTNMSSDNSELKDSLEVHENLVEVIGGLTKLHQSMCSMLRAALISGTSTKAANMDMMDLEDDFTGKFNG
jgi:hypothetical protein